MEKPRFNQPSHTSQQLLKDECQKIKAGHPVSTTARSYLDTVLAELAAEPADDEMERVRAKGPCPKAREGHRSSIPLFMVCVIGVIWPT